MKSLYFFVTFILLTITLNSCNENPTGDEAVEEAGTYPKANVYFWISAQFLDLISPLSNANVKIEGKEFPVINEGACWVDDVSAKEQLISIRHENIIPFDTLIYLEDGKSYHINLNYNIDSSDLDCDYFPINVGNMWKFKTDYNPDESIYPTYMHKYEGELTWEVMSIEKGGEVKYNIREIYDGAKHTFKATEDDLAIEYVIDTTYFNITESNHTLTFRSPRMMLSEIYLISNYQCENTDILE